MSETDTETTDATPGNATPVKKRNGAAKASKAKAPRAAKSTKTKMPKQPRPPKQDLVVFAFRLTQAERDAIHATAGARNATQFVRRVAVAFANQDEGAFRAVVKDAAAAHQ